MRFLIAALICACVWPACAAQDDDLQAIAFIDVNVVAMENEGVLSRQDVLIRGKKIAAIGATRSLSIPANARRIEGRGEAYLLPGLADMHIHIWEAEDVAPFVANGVTTVLHMGGAISEIVNGANAMIERGELVGPHMYFAMLIDGSPRVGRYFVSSPEEMRHAVGLAKTNGYTFIKLYNDVTAEEFEAAVDEGRKRGMAVIGHGVRAVGLPRGLFAGQVMVAHGEEFFYTAFNRQPRQELIPEVVAETRRSGAFVTPNLAMITAIAKQWGKPAVAEEFVRRPEARYVSPSTRLWWIARNQYTGRSGDISEMVPFLRTFTKALSDANIPLLAGTDTPLPGMLPGYSLHEELQALVEAGLTPYQALRAATRAPGDFMQKHAPATESFGVIRVGTRADLVLAAGNPLDGLAVLKAPLGVMAAGRWRTAEELRAILEQQRARMEGLLR